MDSSTKLCLKNITLSLPQSSMKVLLTCWRKRNVKMRIRSLSTHSHVDGESGDVRCPQNIAWTSQQNRIAAFSSPNYLNNVKKKTQKNPNNNWKKNIKGLHSLCKPQNPKLILKKDVIAPFFKLNTSL